MARAAEGSMSVLVLSRYRLSLSLEQRDGAVLLRVMAAQVVRTKEGELPALASVVREVLNELPEGAEAWLHAGTFNNGLLAVPAGGWALERGGERRPRFRPLTETPAAARSSLRFGEPDAALFALGDGVHDAVPGVAR